MDLEIIISSEVSQTDKDTYEITNMWNPIKNDTKELIHKTETDSKSLKPNLGLPNGKHSGGGINWEVEMYTLKYTKLISNTRPTI